MDPSSTGRAQRAAEAFTVEEFCRTHRISRPFYYVLRARGQGPDEMRLGKRVVISNESARRWRKRHTRSAKG
jgi:hypothetical protein